MGDSLKRARKILNQKGLTSLPLFILDCNGNVMLILFTKTIGRPCPA